MTVLSAAFFVEFIVALEDLVFEFLGPASDCGRRSPLNVVHDITGQSPKIGTVRSVGADFAARGHETFREE
jgi:hypothetical protein